jgi:3-oxoacyl-[acyl-carrier protein] reductase
MSKTILITGSSKGIGKATALRFAKDGNNIVINYLTDKDGAEEIVLEIKKLGSKAVAIQADVTKEDEAKRLVDSSIQEFKTIDVLINNVGGYIDGDEWNGSTQVWKDTFDKNIVSTLNVSKFVIPIFQANQKGTIINLSSRYCNDGQVDAIAYAASKAAIVNITNTYAKLLAPFGTANSIAPGPVNTGYWLRAEKSEIEENLNMIPLKSFVEPIEVADLIHYLCSDSAKMITGQNIFIDGGYSSIK